MPEEMRKFGPINEIARPDKFIRFLDTTSGLNWAQAGKQKSLALLKLEPAQRVLEGGCGLVMTPESCGENASGW